MARTRDWANGYCPYLNVDISYSSQNGDTVYYNYSVSYCTTSGGAAYTNGRGRDWNFKVDGYVVASGSININGSRGFGVHSGSFSVSKSKNARNVTAEINMYMDVSWAGTYAGWVSGSQSLSIPARTYNAHGNPTFTASKSTINYGESITLSWAKGSPQGNANFDRFELWRGDKQLYKGAGLTYSVTPSNATGAQGGEVTYTLKEVHEWYGTYPTKSVSITINVRSGVVTAYDAQGNKHTGLVTAYDASGVAHFVLITAYDASGNPHSVV